MGSIKIKQMKKDWRLKLSGVLAITVAIAAISALLGGITLGLSLWAMLLLYSLSGTVAMLFVAWRRFRCIEFHEQHAERGLDSPF